VPRPRTLAAAGIALLACAVLLDVFVYRSPPPPAATPTSVVTTSPVPPPFGIESIHVLDATAYAVNIEWVTTEPSTGRVRWGPAAMKPLLWSPELDSATRHVARLEGLAANSTYVARATARSDAGELAEADLSFTTPPAPTTLTADVRDSVVRVDGGAFLPVIVWQQCPDRFAENIAEGVNVFAGTQCVPLPTLQAGSAGKALLATTSEDGAEVGGASVVGWFYPDEADARGLTGASLPAAPPGLRFLTVTHHFFASAPPLPAGRDMYADLFAKADVVGFDLYPLQEICRSDFLPEVFDAQRELVDLVPGKPTFQWIEAREFKCPQLAVTPKTVRAETWLALAGGAHGLGYFPKDWDPVVGEAIGGAAARIHQLVPALLRPALPVEVRPSGAVRASARSLNGALYVIAVNGGTQPATVQLRVRGLGERRLLVVGTEMSLEGNADVLTDTLPPLGVRIYVAPPAS
jgi:hypothetical protein